MNLVHWLFLLRERLASCYQATLVPIRPRSSKRSCPNQKVRLLKVSLVRLSTFAFISLSSPSIHWPIAINKPASISSAQVIRNLQHHFNPSALFAPWLVAERSNRKIEVRKLQSKSFLAGSKFGPVAHLSGAKDSVVHYLELSCCLCEMPCLGREEISCSRSLSRYSVLT